MTVLQQATELARQVTRPYPNDSATCRAARTALLAEEIELRGHIERVAEQRRALPLGGEPPQEYRFTDQDGRDVDLADLFGPHDTLVTYFWTFGPQCARPCSMCTAFLGALDASASDLAQRVAVAVIGRSPAARQLAFARERGWRNLRFLATTSDDFPRDYRGLAADGSKWPALDVWVKRDGRVRHFWGSELGGTADPDQDPRGAPDPMPLWNILDLTPAGRGTDWYPKLDYGTAA